MIKFNKTKVDFFYQILLSVSIIIAAVCLIWGCLYIYYSGEGYSHEIVANTFSKISIPVYICIAITVGSLILNLIFKNNIRKPKFYKPKNFDQKKPPKLDAKKLYIIKVSLIIIGIMTFVFGALTGGFADVLTKAVNICTECIGLG